MINGMDDFEIEPLSDEALEGVAGGKSSDGPNCCSCSNCSNDGPKTPTAPAEEASAT